MISVGFAPVRFYTYRGVFVEREKRLIKPNGLSFLPEQHTGHINICTRNLAWEWTQRNMHLSIS